MQIQDTDDGVLINGYLVAGWIDESTCPACTHAAVLHLLHDARFCAYCNQWLDRACGDATCVYCAGRPERPLPPAVASA